MARTEEHVWYLQEWFATQQMKQRDLVTKLDWLPAKANKIWHGIQPFRREELVEIASLLNIQPHELLMPPEEAMRIRRMESMLKEIAGGEAATASLAADTEVAPKQRRAG